MTTSNEKLANLANLVVPELLTMLDEAAAENPMVGLGLRALRPRLEHELRERINAQLARPPAELDAILARWIGHLGNCRSDDARPIFVTAGGSFYVATAGCPGECLTDPVSAQDLRDGSDELGQVAPGPVDVPGGGGAAVGDRPGGFEPDGDAGLRDVLGPVEVDEPVG